MSIEEANKRILEAERTGQKKLDLSGLQLERLKLSTSLGAITHLDLSSNKLTNLPEGIEALTRINTLNISKNLIHSLTSDIADLPALKTLVASENPINFISRAINYSQLVALALDSCNLHDIPIELDGAENLRSLDLAGNPISEINFRRIMLPNVKFLNLSYCAIMNIVGVDTLSRLETLLLSQNLITQIPQGLAGLENLKSLNLRSNRIAHISDAQIAGMQLVSLRLDDNKLEDLPNSLGLMESLTYVGRGSGLFYKHNPMKGALAKLSRLPQPLCTSETLEFLKRRQGYRTPETVIGSLLEAVPEQVSGVQFEVGADGMLRLSPRNHIDEQGNNRSRLVRLQPQLVELTKQLSDDLSTGNMPYLNLRDRVDQYKNAIDQPLDHVDFDLMYVFGVRLLNSISSTRKQIGVGELPQFSDSVDEKLVSLSQLHSILIMSTASGQEMLQNEARFTRDSKQQSEFEDAMASVIAGIGEQGDLVTTEVSALLNDIHGEIGKGENREKSNGVAASAAYNALVTIGCAAVPSTIGLVLIPTGPAGVVATGVIALLSIEALKSSKPFKDTVPFFTRMIDELSEDEFKGAFAGLAHRLRMYRAFVESNRERFERLAASNESFKWIAQFLEKSRVQESKQSKPLYKDSDNSPREDA